jgi:hypothetical protein
VSLDFEGDASALRGAASATLSALINTQAGQLAELLAGADHFRKVPLHMCLLPLAQSSPRAASRSQCDCTCASAPETTTSAVPARQCPPRSWRWMEASTADAHSCALSRAKLHTPLQQSAGSRQQETLRRVPQAGRIGTSEYRRRVRVAVAQRGITPKQTRVNCFRA